MPEYPIQVPKSRHESQVAASIESYINERFESVAAERMTFSYRVIAMDLAVPIETVRDLLEPLEGGDEGLMIWRDRRRKPRAQ